MPSIILNNESRTIKVVNRPDSLTLRHTGKVGPQGPTGPTGNVGATGASGTIGIDGVTGATGPQGSTGSGATGASGVQGATGATGIQGATGAGTTGATGAASTVAGATGSTGPTGITGATGPAGTNGINGNTGATGTQGVNGITGATGPQGTTGATGAGVTGATGTQGIQGNTGSTGATGEIGIDWQAIWNIAQTYFAGDAVTWNGSAYYAISGSLASEPGVTPGWEDDWQIIVEGGADGATGSTGPQGSTGATGAASTVAGATGSTGPAGSNGATGATGTAGAAGQGVPTGGSTGQLLSKASGTNYDTAWTTKYPGNWTNYTPSFSGWSGTPTTYDAYYRYLSSDSVEYIFKWQSTNTSTSGDAIISVPVVGAAGNARFVFLCHGTNNNVQTSGIVGLLYPADTNIAFYTTPSFGGFTASGAKSISSFHLIYKV